MTKPLLSLFLAACCAIGANGQSLPEKASQETYVMTDKGIVGSLVLDTAQRRQLEHIEQAYQQDMDALADNDTINEGDSKAEADRLARARHERFKEVLTAEQYEAWVRMLADAEVP